MKSALRNCITIILIIFCLLFMTSYLQNNKIVMPETPTVADAQKTNEPISSEVMYPQESIQQAAEPQHFSEATVVHSIPVENNESPTDKKREYNIQLDRNSPFYSVLFENATFRHGEKRVNLKVSEVGSMVSSQEGFFVDVLRYALVDIDKDGEKELLLDLDHYTGTVVLKTFDDGIYGYYLWLRMMKDIKATGDFWGTGGMSGGSGKISFSKNGFERANVLYYEAIEFENRIIYKYNGAFITESEYNQRFSAFEALPEPEWYDYYIS